MKFRTLKPLTILSTLLIIILCFTASASAFFVSSEKTHVGKIFFSNAFFTRNFSPLTADNTPVKNYDDKKNASVSLLATKSVKPGDRGTYNELKNQKKLYGQTEPVEMHEMPSFAAKREAFIKKFGRKPTPAEEQKLRDMGVSEAVTPNVHAKTRTYRGRNTTEQIQKDAEDLNATQELDEMDLLNAKQ